MGVFREKWRALVTAAVLPGTGRDPLVVLRKEAEAEGYPLLAGSTPTAGRTSSVTSASSTRTWPSRSTSSKR